MKYRAYLQQLNSEDVCVGGLNIKSVSGNLEITSDTAETIGKFYRQIHLLQTGLIMYGYQHRWSELIEVSAYPTAQTAEAQEKAIAVPLPVWKEIEWIFTDENHLAAYWCGAAIAANDISRKYLALYYGYNQLKRMGQLNQEELTIWEQLKKVADQVRCEEEELEEKGLEIPDPVFDPDFVKTVTKQLFDKVDGRKNNR